MAIDFDREFENFIGTTGNSAIKDIYNIIPALSQEQLLILDSLMFYSNKYNIDEFKEFVNEYKRNMIKNKNLGFLRSMNMKNLLKAYTQDELIRGIKVNNTTNSSNEGV